jgi:hypothetical protein
MSEVLEGSGGFHNSRSESWGDDEEDAIGGAVGELDAEFTLQSLRSLVVDGLR